MASAYGRRTKILTGGEHTDMILPQGEATIATASYNPEAPTVPFVVGFYDETSSRALLLALSDTELLALQASIEGMFQEVSTNPEQYSAVMTPIVG